MKVDLNLVLMDADGKKVLTRWKTAAAEVDADGMVFMTTFDEDIYFNRGDVLIGEIICDSSSPSK